MRETMRAVFISNRRQILLGEGNGSLSVTRKQVLHLADSMMALGHTISGINCEDAHASLFAELSGEVRNLGVENCVFRGEYAGGIISRGNETARVANCYNKAEIIGKTCADGIAVDCSGLIVFWY